MSRCRVGILRFQLVPVFEIRIVNSHLGSHLGKLSNDDLRAAVAGVTDILPITRSAQEYGRAGYLPAHVSKSISRQRRYVQAASIVYVDSRRCNLEYGITESEDVFICPVSKTAVFRKTVTADAGTGEDYIVWVGL